MTAAYTDYQSIHYKIDKQLFFNNCKENQPVVFFDQSSTCHLPIIVTDSHGDRKCKNYQPSYRWNRVLPYKNTTPNHIL